MEKISLPIWEKYALSVEEAAAYFHVGEARLRRLISERPDADWLLMIGTQARIKRKKFEAFLDRIDAL